MSEKDKNIFILIVAFWAFIIPFMFIRRLYKAIKFFFANTNKRQIMITEDYVSFEIAKLLKEKGFDENCAALYDLRTGEISQQGVGYVFNNSQWENFITAPTLQMALKWLREVHHILIVIRCCGWDSTLVYFSYFRRIPSNKFIDDTIELQHFKTYEEACEAAIKYCLENLI